MIISEIIKEFKVSFDSSELPLFARICKSLLHGDEFFDWETSHFARGSNYSLEKVIKTTRYKSLDDAEKSLREYLSNLESIGPVNPFY